MHRETRIHLLDTPGYADFVGQSMTALEAVDTAANATRPLRRKPAKVSRKK